MKIPLDGKSPPRLGFLTALRDTDHGWFGGLLLVNLQGRPVEFHCTAPVKPSRAQEILYGPTLEPFLVGEHLGAALVEHARDKPLALLTDHPAMVSVQEPSGLPVSLLLAEGMEMPAGWETAGCGDVELASPPEQSALLHRAARLIQPFAERWELAEPFRRVREAIEEARRAA